ncbi:MAG: hypothetical protein JO257_13550 [Deltaproteobacteria bacterium]|nr:hypothetical protein [Deltaproteobacteria bacterium]
MRVALLVLAGCGRLAFDPSVPSADAPRTADASADTNAAPDAAPICASPCTVADSLADWDGVNQDTKGWSYGYWWAETDPDGVYSAATDFTPMVSVSGLWRPPDFDPNTTSANYTWCYLAQWGGHPGFNPQRKYPVRRWTSTVAGLAAIAIHVDKSDPNGGDGVQATLIVDGATVWQQAIDGTDATGVTHTATVVLHAGSTVDYMLDPRADDAVDTTDEQLTISGP